MIQRNTLPQHVPYRLLEGHSLLVVLNRLRQLAHFPMDSSKVRKHGSSTVLAPERLVDLQAFLEAFDGALRLASFIEGGAEVEKRVGLASLVQKLPAELEAPLEVRDRALRLSLDAVDISEIRKSLRLHANVADFHKKRQALLKAIGAALKLAQVPVDVAHASEGIGARPHISQLLGHRHGLLVVRDSPLRLAGGEHVAQARERRHHRELVAGDLHEAEGLGEALGGLLDLGALPIRLAQRRQGVLLLPQHAERLEDVHAFGVVGDRGGELALRKVGVAHETQEHALAFQTPLVLAGVLGAFPVEAQIHARESQNRTRGLLGHEALDLVLERDAVVISQRRISQGGVRSADFVDDRLESGLRLRLRLGHVFRHAAAVYPSACGCQRPTVQSKGRGNGKVQRKREYLGRRRYTARKSKPQQLQRINVPKFVLYGHDIGIKRATNRGQRWRHQNTTINPLQTGLSSSSGPGPEGVLRTEG
eukprot:scaffold7052_cov254-Pinguiococcus_pyrenoidosus.AAC.42